MNEKEKTRPIKKVSDGGRGKVEITDIVPEIPDVIIPPDNPQDPNDPKRRPEIGNDLDLPLQEVEIETPFERSERMRKEKPEKKNKKGPRKRKDTPRENTPRNRYEIN